MRDNPFRIEGPALVSFSGGRTSGYMLDRIVCAWDGVLPHDVVVTFANTGREMPETLAFVRDCGERFGAEVVWLEYQPGEAGRRWKRVDYASAARNGEPFDALLRRKRYLPNVVTRFCTQELKIRPMRDFARSLGWGHWTNVVGLRADERYRVAALKAGAQRERWDVAVPLAQVGITKQHIEAYWSGKNWGLQLPSANGLTPLGNCDGCFLKGAATLAGIMRLHPDRAAWWIAKEAETGGQWSKRFAYADLARQAGEPDLFAGVAEAPTTDCYCTGDR